MECRDITNITYDPIEIYNSQKDIENYDMKVECKTVDMEDDYFVLFIIITAFYYNTQKVISLKVYNSFLIKGKFSRSKEGIKFQAELTHIAIAQTRAIFFEEAKKIGYPDILLPHQPLEKIIEDVQNGVYSFLN